MRFLLALALILVSVGFGSRSGAEPLNEAAPGLACPECGTIMDAIQVPEGILAVGERGLIIHGTSGSDWRQLAVPVRRMLTAVAEAGNGHLVAVGHDALILENPGIDQAWTVVRINPERDTPLLDIWMAGDGRGLAVGAYGLVLATEDHGRNWSPRQLDPEEPHFYAVREDSEGSLFIVGEFGTVLRSRDQGENWVSLDTGWDGSFFGLRAGPGRLLLYGLEGTVLDSRDGGESWQRLESGVSSSLYDAVFMPDGRAVVVGADGTVLVESTGNFRRLPSSRRKAFTTVLVSDLDSVLLLGENGVNRLSLLNGDPVQQENRP